MRKVEILLATILFLPVLGYNAQTERKEVDTIELTDPMPPGVPFLLKRGNMFLGLSSALDSQNVIGIIGLTVFINGSETITGFKVMKMRVEKDGDSMSFTNESEIKGPQQKSEYPEEVQSYYASIESYVNSLVYERDENIPLEELNELTFMAKLK